MTSTEIRAALIGILARVAPETRGQQIPDGADLREELELDSMDFLKFVVGLHDTLGVDVPEADYPQVTTLAGAVRYVAARKGA